MPRPLSLQQSRTVPVEVERAFDATLTAPLPRVISRRFGPLPPVREVRDQPPAWGQVGQTRTIVTSDGGTMREELVVVERPHRFGYRLDHVTGPMRPVAASIVGAWSFEPVGTGARISWAWTVHPASPLAVLALPVLARLWPTYAARVLEQVEDLLLAP